MIKVYMKRDNDCLKACLASIFEITYESGFDPVGKDDWLHSLKTWSIIRGWLPLLINSEIEQLEDWIYWSDIDIDKIIGVGPSPRGNYDHAVVVSPDLQILHDPKDPCEQLKEITYVIGFQKL